MLSTWSKRQVALAGLLKLNLVCMTCVILFFLAPSCMLRLAPHTHSSGWHVLQFLMCVIDCASCLDERAKFCCNTCLLLCCRFSAASCKLSIPVAGLSGFMEKPSGDALHKWKGVSKNATEQDPFEASMGIYVFKREALVQLLYFLTDTSVAACRDAPGVVPSMHEIVFKLRPIFLVIGV